MPRAEARTLRFVRALLPDTEALCRDGKRFCIESGSRKIALPRPEVQALLSAGVLAGDASRCRPGPGTRSWLRRQLLAPDGDGFAGQHRDEVPAADGARKNLRESPLARLATAAAGEAEPFLSPHQVEAGERVRKLAERAQLQPRLTMSYSLAHTASGAGSNGVADLTDLAASSRRALAEIFDVLPRDCAGVVLDVCGLLKGLQTVESERGWPRRSAKLVLRIGLDQLARHYGLDASASGRPGRKPRSWIGVDARPTIVG